MAIDIAILDDAKLATLRVNALRVEASSNGARQQEASELLSLIDSELTHRAEQKSELKAKAATATAKKAAAPKKPRLPRK